MDGGRNRDWRDGFLFVGNQSALDFLNTRLVPEEEPVEMIPDFPSLLRWFKAAGLLDSSQAAGLLREWEGTDRSRRLMKKLRALRESLRKEVSAWEGGRGVSPAMVARLNQEMADHPIPTRLLVKPGGASLDAHFEARQPEDLLAPLVHSAAALFARADGERVRKCRRCVVHFLDTSKKGNRTWCSMRLCGNRLKVAAYAARKRRRRGKAAKRRAQHESPSAVQGDPQIALGRETR